MVPIPSESRDIFQPWPASTRSWECCGPSGKAGITQLSFISVNNCFSAAGISCKLNKKLPSSHSLQLCNKQLPRLGPFPYYHRPHARLILHRGPAVRGPQGETPDRWWASCHPEETLHCCRVTSVVFSNACSDSTYAGHHLPCPC